MKTHSHARLLVGTALLPFAGCALPGRTEPPNPVAISRGDGEKLIGERFAQQVPSVGRHQTVNGRQASHATSRCSTPPPARVG